MSWVNWLPAMSPAGRVLQFAKDDPVAFWGAVAIMATFALLLYAFRERLFMDFYAGLMIRRTRYPRREDYIKLADGEEGYVAQVGWRITRINGLRDSVQAVPNWRLARSLISAYHQRIKWAQEPFRFYARFTLSEATDMVASNVLELVQCLRRAPDAVTYHHTFNFMRQHHYLKPQFPSEFAYWVKEVLGDHVLGQQLAAVDTCEFTSLIALRRKLIEVMEQHLLNVTEMREVAPGHEFRFMRAVNMVVPTPYVARDIRQFAEILPRVNSDSVFLHFVEAKLRLHDEVRDMCYWLENSLGNPDLATEVSRISPYTHTLGEMQQAIIDIARTRLEQ